MASLRLDEKDVGEAVSASSSPVLDEGIGIVKEKYHGTESDKHEMDMLGKKQVLRVSLSLLPVIACASTILTFHSATFPSSQCWGLPLPAFHPGRAYSHILTLFS